jgi:hypothetical protein
LVDFRLSILQLLLKMSTGIENTNCLIKNVTEGVDKTDTLTHKLMLPKEDSETEGYGYASTEILGTRPIKKHHDGF